MKAEKARVLAVLSSFQMPELDIFGYKRPGNLPVDQCFKG
jgi:hypothetical protein